MQHQADANCSRGKSLQYTIASANDYFPFGKTLRSFNNTNKYAYQGSEKEKELSDNDYYTHFRSLETEIARWKQVDPVFKPSESPYVSMGNNPVHFTDILGDNPGDLFKTTNEAALDFGMYLNDNSIRNNKEYATVIIKVVKDGETFYTYKIPVVGEKDETFIAFKESDGVVADIHSHGKYIKGYDNNNFSEQDIAGNNKTATIGYLTTPSGMLKKYDPKTGKTTVVSTKLPSDEKDPERKNKVDAKVDKQPVEIKKNGEKPKGTIIIKNKENVNNF